MLLQKKHKWDIEKYNFGMKMNYKLRLFANNKRQDKYIKQIGKDL